MCEADSGWLDICLELLHQACEKKNTLVHGRLKITCATRAATPLSIVIIIRDKPSQCVPARHWLSAGHNEMPKQEILKLADRLEAF